MDDTRVTLIISMLLALGFSAYLAINLQDIYTNPTKQERPRNTSLTPTEKWRVTRDQRAIDLNEARKQGISHSLFITQKCNCPNLLFNEKAYTHGSQEKAIAKWRYLECKKACENISVPATNTP